MSTTAVKTARAPGAKGRDAGRPALLNRSAIVATWRRQLSGLLLNPLGYVFILVFVLASAAILFWPAAFYSRNIADLDLLLVYMPWLLVVLLPTLAMGTWASERELGTDEQLLTLPLSTADVLLGKWLGVMSYFTLALLCTLSNVVVLAWLGRPDPGLTAATYVGWWLAGAVFAALGIFASTLVSMPAVGFVLGLLFCGAAMGMFWWADWFDPFNRGLLPLGRLVSALVLTALSLGAAVLVLSVRRWQPARRTILLGQCAIFVCLCVTGLNLGVQADRAAVDWDWTQEKLSSLSPASRTVLAGLNEPAKVVAFISQDLPPELQLKGKEVENTLKVLQRSLGDRLKIEIHRPADPLDADGSLATQFYDLSPRKVTVSAASGRDTAEVFLAAAISSGPRTQKIDYFDPGLSVEYELVRALRSVAAAKRKVLGVVRTDMNMFGGFDFQMRSSTPRWQIVSEWEKQYDVREVNLDAPVGNDVDVLVVPQPSRLGGEQIRRLHDYIWAGRPALLMEDPLPAFSGPQMGTSQPKRPSNPMSGEPPQEAGDLEPLLTALGLDIPADQIVWSDYNPSYTFRKLLTPAFVWAYRSQGSIIDAPVTTGIQSLLLPFPGGIRALSDRGPGLTVKALVRPSPASPWGINRFGEYMEFNPMFGGMRQTQPKRFDPMDGEPPGLVVEVTGTMARAFPFEQPTPPATTSATSQPATAPSGVGQASAKPIHVIYVADTDLANDQFYEFYRNADNRFNQEELRFLQDLGNIQLMGNMVDALAGDQGFLGLRTRRAQRRPLEKLDQLLAQTQKSLREVESAAQKDAEQRIQALRDSVTQRLDKIRARQDLDDNAKAQLVAQLERSANRQLETDIQEVNRQADLKTRKAQIDQQRAFQRVLNYGVRLKAMGIPALVLAVVVAAVFALRLRGERLIVPESRRRHSK